MAANHMTGLYYSLVVHVGLPRQSHFLL